MSIPHQELDRLLNGSHFDPHALLGRHVIDGQCNFRTLKPIALSVALHIGDSTFPMISEAPGVWFLSIPASDLDLSAYSFEAQYQTGSFHSFDAFAFLPTIGDTDLHLISEGRHEQLWQVLGAHPQSFQQGSIDVTGTAFSVWAPNARGVRVVGDFNYWDGSAHPMRTLGSSGVWEIFIPGVVSGTAYKFSILDNDGNWLTKADPMAFATQLPPENASIVCASNYVWGDSVWLERRANINPHVQPMTTYEVHLGSWKWGLDYLSLARELVDHVISAGFTHVELMPVAEHPYGPSWGYQVTSYYAPTSRFGTPDQFRHLVDTLHQNGIGVILDWVPAHFPKDEWALAQFDGTHLYEHEDPRQGQHPDWGTLIFDYGRNEVRNFLVANAVYWLEEFHIDGLRVDAVTSMLYLDYSREIDQWLPNQYGGNENLDAVTFLQEMNATVYRRVPGVITIAEESTSWPGVTRSTDLGGLGFGFKWNMGWMHDSLGYVQHENIHRRYHHDEMTFSLMYSFTENFILPFSHDEVVHGKGSLIARMPGDRWQALANLRAYLAFMWAHPGKKLLFMGSEFAQSSEWSSEQGLDWHLLQFKEHQGILRTVSDLNNLYTRSRALWERDNDPRGFEWIDSENIESNIFSWIRWSDHGECMAFIANFSPEVHHDFPLVLPKVGRWKEVLNTDSAHYGGSGVGNLGNIDAKFDEWSGKPALARITVPPLAAVFFEFTN